VSAGEITGLTLRTRKAALVFLDYGISVVETTTSGCSPGSFYDSDGNKVHSWAATFVTGEGVKVLHLSSAV